MKEFREIGTAGLPVSNISETSCFQSQMLFHDSAESIADSDLEDGVPYELVPRLSASGFSETFYLEKTSASYLAQTATQRLPFDTWNQSQERRFLEINVPRLIHPGIILKEFSLAHHKEKEEQFLKLQGRRHFS